MNPFESTIESPLRFLLSYIQYDGESYLHKQFVSANEIDFRFIPQKDVIYVQKILHRDRTKGLILDEETNTCEYELTFSEYIQEELEVQFEISKSLIIQQSKQNGKDQDAKLYGRLLIDCKYAQKYIDSSDHINYKEDLSKYITNILTFAYRKFERYYPGTKEIHQVKAYYKSKTQSNTTGFKLKPQVRNAPLRVTIDKMIHNNIVTRRTRRESLEQFFNGEKPNEKIDWHIDPHEIYYFIDQFSNDKILERKPGHKWEKLDQMFTKDGIDLPQNWYRNNNKLKDQNKRKAIDEIIVMLSPRE